MTPPLEGGKELFIKGPGHMTKMAVMPIYGKNLEKIISYRTYRPMIFKLGMEHYVFKIYKVYINDDPKLTIIFCTTISNYAKIVFVLTVGPDVT